MSEEFSLEDLPQPTFKGTVSPDELETDGENPNEQSDETFGLLCERIRERGWLGGPIVADSDGLIADGEHRYRAALEIGLDEVPVEFYDFSDADRRMVRQELNKISGEHDRKRDALEYDYLLDAGKSDEVHALTKAAEEDLDELLAEIKMETSRPAAYDYDPEHNVYFEDCVEGMQERVEDDSIDAVISDPPYGFDYQNTSHAEQDFDSLENFDDWELFENCLDQFRRVLKEDGHVYVWWGWQFYGKMERMFRQRFDHVDTLVWVKNNFGLNGHSNDRYRPQYEVCFHGTLGDAARPLEDANTLSDVLEFDRDDGADYDHPTQKPVPLIADIIGDCTAPGDTVLDAFLGSGTTAVAAIQNDRDYIGFEIDEENYRPVIERRIGEAKRQVDAEVNADD